MERVMRDRVVELLHAALLLQAEPGETMPGRGLLSEQRMEGESWIEATMRIEAAESHVIDLARAITPADLDAAAYALWVAYDG